VALIAYAYDNHDMGLLYAQEPGIAVTVKFPAFVIPAFIREMLTAQRPTSVSTGLEAALSGIASLLNEDTELNALGSDPANAATAFPLGVECPLNRNMYERFSKLSGLVNQAFLLLNMSGPQTSGRGGQMDATSLK
jgi:hypothetical protein